MFVRVQTRNGFAAAGENVTRWGIAADTCRHKRGECKSTMF